MTIKSNRGHPTYVIHIFRKQWKQIQSTKQKKKKKKNKKNKKKKKQNRIKQNKDVIE